MTYEEAKEKVKNFCVGCTDVTKCDDCEFPIIYKALEKQIPKKPKMDNDNGIYEVEVCPYCMRRLFPNEHHCKCGQALDWSE